MGNPTHFRSLRAQRLAALILCVGALPGCAAFIPYDYAVGAELQQRPELQELRLALLPCVVEVTPAPEAASGWVSFAAFFLPGFWSLDDSADWVMKADSDFAGEWIGISIEELVEVSLFAELLSGSNLASVHWRPEHATGHDITVEPMVSIPEERLHVAYNFGLPGVFTKLVSFFTMVPSYRLEDRLSLTLIVRDRQGAEVARVTEEGVVDEWLSLYDGADSLTHLRALVLKQVHDRVLPRLITGLSDAVQQGRVLVDGRRETMVETLALAHGIEPRQGLVRDTLRERGQLEDLLELEESLRRYRDHHRRLAIVNDFQLREEARKDRESQQFYTTIAAAFMVVTDPGLQTVQEAEVEVQEQLWLARKASQAVGGADTSDGDSPSQLAPLRVADWFSRGRPALRSVYDRYLSGGAVRDGALALWERELNRVVAEDVVGGGEPRHDPTR